MGKGLTIDGGYGEGGGQILRSALALSVITGRGITVVNIRARRPKPGLAAQHLAAVRAAASVCDAEISGAQLGSTQLTFSPRGRAKPGKYVFDVASSSATGSAGSALLVLHTLLYPLALSSGPSELVIHGGTHVPRSPTTDHARDVWLPALATMGIDATLTEERTGWYPAGNGAITARIHGRGRTPIGPLRRTSRGTLIRVGGRALAANLPAHIPQRMADRARSLLAASGISSSIATERVTAACPGACIFLFAEYSCGARAGFSVLGTRGKPSEAVAEEAVEALLAHDRGGAAVDRYLSDQLVLPCSLAREPSAFSVAEASRHLSTNLWVVAQFDVAHAEIHSATESVRIVRIIPTAKSH